jgi:hypothetical protein
MAVGPSRLAQVALLKVFLPGRPERTAVVFLLDQATGHLYFRIREDWDRIADANDAELLSELGADLYKRLDELGQRGGAEFLGQLEDQLSNVLRLTERQEIAITDVSSTLDRLFDENCLD